MHVHFIASYRSLIDVYFPNMDTVAGSVLYFDGTWGYTAVARSFAAFGGSYTPDAGYIATHTHTPYEYYPSIACMLSKPYP